MLWWTLYHEEDNVLSRTIIGEQIWNEMSEIRCLDYGFQDQFLELVLGVELLYKASIYKKQYFVGSPPKRWRDRLQCNTSQAAGIRCTFFDGLDLGRMEITLLILPENLCHGIVRETQGLSELKPRSWKDSSTNFFSLLGKIIMVYCQAFVYVYGIFLFVMYCRTE